MHEGERRHPHCKRGVAPTMTCFPLRSPSRQLAPAASRRLRGAATQAAVAALLRRRTPLSRSSPPHPCSESKPTATALNRGRCRSDRAGIGRIERKLVWIEGAPHRRAPVSRLEGRLPLAPSYHCSPGLLSL
jgi:hypothetical protein